MQFKSITTQFGGRLINIELPDKKSIILDGDEEVKHHVMGVIRSLLCFDYNNDVIDHFGSVDVFNTKSSLLFTDGSLSVKNKAVHLKGRIPNLHIVELRYGCDLLSCLSDDYNGNTDTSMMEKDLTVYDESISDDIYTNIATMCNKIVGRDYVLYNPGELLFDWGGDEDTDYLKSVYLLVAESFCTPSNYLRIILLENASSIPDDKIGTLIESIDNIRGLEMVICSMKVSPDTLGGSNAVAYVPI